MSDEFILNLITKDVDFKPDYTDIADKVIIEKYISRKKKLNFGFFSLLTAAVAIICAIIIPVSLNQRVTYIDGDRIIYESDIEFINAFDYVFIAKVVDKTGTKRYDGTGTDIPYTFYELEVEEFYKGDGERSETLCFYGGKNVLGTVLCKINDEIPKVGDYYLFIVNRKKENSLNERIGERDFICSVNDNKIRLDNYKTGVPLSEQEENVKLIVGRYKNIIDKTVGTTTAPLEFENDKALVDYFDYIFIAKPEYQLRADGSGSGSEVVSAFYEISVLNYLKNKINAYNGRICVYGADYWGTGGVTLPKEGSVYLVFANKKPTDCDNGRIDENDFIIFDNCQMVLLENYNCDIGYTKQSDEIMKILNRFIAGLE